MDLLITPAEAAHATRLRPGWDAVLLSPELQALQDVEVTQMLGPALVQQLLAQKQARNLSLANERLYGLLKAGVAWLALSRTLPTFHYSTGGTGVQVTETPAEVPATPGEVQYLVTRYAERGMRLLRSAQQLLQNQRENYPHYSGRALPVGGVYLPPRGK